MMKNICSFFVFLLVSSAALAQEQSFVDSIFSKVYHQQRKFYVYLPASYWDTRFAELHYPVIYVLDGEKQYGPVQSMVNYLSTGVYAQMPQSIVIGLIQEDRASELTPKAAENSTYPNSGKAEFFEAFIKAELMPHLEQKYKILTGHNTIIGHSFGGLFVANLLQKGDQVFNNKLLLDPSIWWDNAALLSRIHNIDELQALSKQKIYLAQAGIEEQNKLHLVDHDLAIQKFHKRLKTCPQVQYHFALYPDDDHGLVPIPATWNALKWFYKGYAVDAKQVIKKPELFNRHVQNWNAQQKLALKPQPFLLIALADLALKRNGKAQAIEILQYARDYYPENNYLQERLAQLLL